MLQPAEAAVGFVRRPRAGLLDQPQPRREVEQSEIADIARELGAAVRVAEHEILDDEFHVDDAAAVVLEIEQRGAVGMGIQQLLAHLRHFAAQHGQFARLAQDRLPHRFEFPADRRVPGDVARPRQCLVFPRPGMPRLILAETFERAHQQPTRPVRSQPQVRLVEHAGGSRGRKQVVHTLREPGVVLGSFRRRIMVEKNQVQIGGIAELLPAELAVADHREARLGAVRLPHRLPGEAQDLLENDAGKIAQVVAQGFERQPSRQVLGNEPHGVHVLEVPQRVQLPLGFTGGIRQLGLQLAGGERPVGSGVQRAHVEQFVEEDRVLGEVLRHPRTRAHHCRELLERPRVLFEQGEVGAAPADRIQQVEHALECRVRIALGGRSLDRRRNQAVEPRLARGGYLAVASARVHGLQPFGDRLSPAVSQRRELGADPGRIVGQIPEMGEGMRRVGRRGEDVLEMAGHAPAVHLQLARERPIVGQAHRVRDERAVGVRLR